MEIKTGLLQQAELGQRITLGFSNYKKSPKDRITSSYIETRIGILEKTWKEFVENHYHLVGNLEVEDREAISYFEKDYYSSCEETYMEYKTKLMVDLKTFKPSNTSGGSSSGTSRNEMASSEVRLPRIQLPRFSGGYDEWQTFHDLFLSLIHKNEGLSAVQKLHYLKSSLSGEAETLLKNLSTTDTNYEEAWKLLIERYSNKRHNCNEIMKRLFLQKSLTTESANGTKQLLDTTSACLKAFENLEIDTKSWDVIINHLVVSKLDQEARKLWELQVSQTTPHDLPTWDQLKKFLETRFRTLEMIEGVKPSAKVSNSTNPKTTTKKSLHASVKEEKKITIACVMCEGEHWMHQCKQFGKLTAEQRSEFVQSKKLCFNCLAPSHSVKFCRQSTSCRRCGRRHHTLLHFDRVNQQPPVSTSTETEPPPSNEPEKRVVAHFAHESQQSHVLLATALVKVQSASGYSQTFRALIDQGSEASFVTESTAQSLGLKRVTINGVVSGVGEGIMRSKGIVSFQLESMHNPNFSIPVNAFVLKNLTSFLPSKTTPILEWPDIENLALADPNYGSPGRIDVILGVDVHSEIILQGLLKHPSLSGPIAQNTQLGWILSGRVSGESTSAERNIVSLHIRVKEDELLKQFWEIEREPDQIEKKMTKEEIRCEEIYEETTKRDETGRYIVRLPFKGPRPECLQGQSKEIARRRFTYLEKKLTKNPQLHDEYKKVIDDYITQHHMVEITDQAQICDPEAVYLPHHAVVREDKETTKVRVVFDASCKGVNNVSLNDNLLVGPKLQQDLRHILMRWRCHAICIVADLVQMYRQVRVQESDTEFQRILWRPNPSDPIKHFRLLRLTFGTACAPYLAVKTLQQVAKDEHSNFPIASEITINDFYMDDVLTGCETQEEAIEIYEQLNSLMRAGGFCLQKWSSNSEELLHHIKRENQRSESVVFKLNDTIKVLGITWNKTRDSFEYALQLPETPENYTKRQVLSEIARLYDPMGWIAPVIFTGKVFMQKLWKSGLEWDQTLTSELTEEWFKFKGDLTNVRNIIVPRWLQTKRDCRTELHGFADASQAGYAAAVYLKSRDADGNITVNLITAKTKVAPVEKEISIPRMELCAALLATKLAYEVCQILHIPMKNLSMWSDSTVVLAWIGGEPHRWSTFVSNRVSEILTMVEKEQWSHVATSQNPADCASRGLPAAELMKHDLWWHGPTWLKNKDYDVRNCQYFTTNEEERQIKALSTTIERKEEFIWTRFSNLDRLLRVLSYCRRMLKANEFKSKPITSEEMNQVLQICIKETQRLYFAEEIKYIQTLGQVPKKSQLHTLCPILDENGILRVGGRIQEAQVKFDTKHPIIMPGESHLTSLIIKDAHKRTLHGGPQIMLNLLRSKYWIIHARNLAKKCYRTCAKCVRYSQQNNTQMMGRLPADRIKPTRPFKISGVDFTGHINIRFSPGRGSKSYKGYICVFVCMISKAIHLEAVSDLTSQGFIAAFRRFVSRRGHCKTLYSDNGTNFVGADRELKDMFDSAISQLPDEITNLLANEGTTWSFIPPHSPNFGGLWEAGVRSTKNHLKRVIGDSTLTFEELTTVLTQIEACLNSRPLSHLSDNSDDPLPLTPGHFLVGEPLIVIPDTYYTETGITGLQRWKLTQKMVCDFWRKWSDEYLVTLNQRYKWATKKADFELNDIVIVKDHNLPPAKWLLGRIVEKHPGKDNLTRVVTIKTKNGLCKRPCSKLCILPKE